MLGKSYLQMKEITPDFLNDYVSYLQNKLNLKANTINKRLERIKVIADLAFKQEVIDRNPFDTYSRQAL